MGNRLLDDRDDSMRFATLVLWTNSCAITFAILVVLLALNG